MSQANVYTTLSGNVWYTDRVRIATGATGVTLQVEAVQLQYLQANGNWANAGTAVGNIYSAPLVVPANSSEEFYVGVGNKITVVGSGYTASEIGTQSSATAGINGVGNA